MRWRAVCVMSVLTLLGGCASDAAGGPPMADGPDYPAGYSDGCATANARGAQIPERPIHQSGLAEQSESYRAGWKAGFGACGGNYINDPLNHR